MIECNGILKYANNSENIISLFDQVASEDVGNLNWL